MSNRDNVFSFVVPADSRLDIIPALESFVANTESVNHECVVVLNNCFLDFVKMLRKKFPQKNIRIFYIRDPNISAARNFGILKAKGNYVVFMDSDCTIGEDYIKQLERAVGGWDLAVGEVIFKRNNTFFSSNYSKLRTYWYRIPVNIYCPNMIVKKQVFDKIGYFDPFLSQTEDSEWSIRFRESDYYSVKIALPMFHSVETSKNICRKWITYGTLRGYRYYRERYYLGVSRREAVKAMFFSPADKYRFRQGLGFFFILFLYRNFRHIGVINGLVKFRNWNTKQVFVERRLYLRSPKFLNDILSLEVKNQ